MEEQTNSTNEPEISDVAQGITQTEKIGKFRASFLLIKESWDILKKDKEMMLFPLLSFFVSIFVFAILGAIVFFVLAGNENLLEDSNQAAVALKYGLVFLVYFISFFITIFFQAGIVAIAHKRLNNEDATFRDGFASAYAHIGKIAMWSLLSATVGVVLRAISDRSKFLGKFVASFFGAAWGIVSFFIVPVLIVENISIKDSLKKSVDIIKKTWGETLIVNIGVGIYFMLLALIGVAVFVLSLIFVNSGAVIVTLGLFLLLYFIVLSVISATLNVIFKVALYEYASTGIVPTGFSETTIGAAFKSKN